MSLCLSDWALCPDSHLPRRWNKGESGEGLGAGGASRSRAPQKGWSPWKWDAHGRGRVGQQYLLVSVLLPQSPHGSRSCKRWVRWALVPGALAPKVGGGTLGSVASGTSGRAPSSLLSDQIGLRAAFLPLSLRMLDAVTLGTARQPRPERWACRPRGLSHLPCMRWAQPRGSFWFLISGRRSPALGLW